MKHTSNKRPGVVVGSAATGLQDASWAVSKAHARAGAKGEHQTARVLNQLARTSGGPGVLHDVKIPGAHANVDHVVVAGNKVFLIDSKVWRAGFYWSFLGAPLRGSKSFPHAKTTTLEFAQDRLKTVLEQAGVDGVEFATPILAVWQSASRGKLSLWALRLPGGKVKHGRKVVSRAMFANPNPLIVSVLSKYVASFRGAES